MMYCPISTNLGPIAASLPTRDVMGVPVVDSTQDQAISYLLDSSVRKISFLNAHCANMRAADSAYAAALNRSDVILPDGIGVELAARMTGVRLTANLNGTDFVPALLQKAAQRGLSVFLLGGRPGTAEAAAQTLARQIPELRVVGTQDGYDGINDSQKVITQINASGADILLVAMGVPLQELWIDTHADVLSPRLLLGVGALFDFLAGNVTRAPAPVRKLRMEWAWRLMMEPRRMARRYLLGNPVFVARALHHATATRDGRREIAKRLFDITLSSALLLCLAPLLLFFMIAIRLDSHGPTLFHQTRIGRHGREFTMYKFRSMYTDAEARRAALLAESDRAGICFKSRHDPRITRIGRWLRRLSIDELPQIFNVLRGDMSFVGPRPALPEEVAAYPEYALHRLNTRPGITGLWQVAGRAEIGFDRMIEMDLAYVRSRSLMLDLVLMVMTVNAVFSGRGAY